MKKVLILAVAIVLPFAAALAFALRQPAPPTERIPNDGTANPANLFPRWLSYTCPEVEDDFVGGFRSRILDDTSVSVDSRNNAHIVFRRMEFDAGQISRIIYTNNIFNTRQANGFAAGFELDSGNANNGEDAIAPDIWVNTINDQVQVVWKHGSNNGPFQTSDIRRAVKTSTGWTFPGTAMVSTFNGELYSYPQVITDSTGVVHVVAHYTPNFGGWTVRYWNSLGALEDVNVSVGANDHTLRIALDPSNRPCIVGSSGGVMAFAERLGPNNWNILGLGTGSGEDRPDIGVDSQGTAHVAWASGQVYYASRPAAGVFGAPEQVSTIAPGFLLSARLLVDSRDQVHVFWTGMNYAAKVKNPGPGLGPWRLQEPAAAPSAGKVMGNVCEVARSKNDQFHAISWPGFSEPCYYTRTIEYGLGGRDALATTPAFPGASVNATSGDLEFRLQLYSTAGVGPCQNFGLTYNALEPYGAVFPPGWRSSYEMFLIDHWIPTNFQPLYPSTIDITLFLPDARAVHFFDYYGNGYLTADDEFGYFSRIERIDPVTFLPTTLSPCNYLMTTKLGDTLLFDTAGRFIKISEPSGNYLQVVYSGGLPTLIKDMLYINPGAGRASTISYESGSNQLRAPRPRFVNDANGKQYEFIYDATTDKLSTVRFNSGPSTPAWTFDYYTDNNEANGRRINLLKTVRPPRGHPTLGNYGYTCLYYLDGRLWKAKDPAEAYLDETVNDNSSPSVQTAEMSMFYDESQVVGADRFTTLTNRRSKQTKWKCDPRRALALEIHDSTVLPTAPPGFSPVIRTFDNGIPVGSAGAYGLITQSTDRWGFVASYAYEATSTPFYVHDNLISLRRPKQNAANPTDDELVASYTYFADGLNRVQTLTTNATPVGSGTPASRTTSYTYEQGQIKTVSAPAVTRPDGASQNAVTTYTYDPSNHRALSQIDEQDGHVTTFGNFSTIHFLPRQVNRADGAGQLGTGQFEEFTYDFMGNRLSDKLPLGNPENESVGSGTVTVLDGMYRVSSVTDPAGQVTTYGYDVDSHVTSVTLVLATGNIVTTTAFDKRGLVSGGKSPDGAASDPNWTQLVDANGNTRRTLDIRGFAALPQFASNVYFDPLDRVIDSRSPGGSLVAGGGGGPTMQTTYVHDGFSAGSHFSSATQIGSPANRVTKTTYTARGLPKAVLQPDLLTQNETFYDEQDQATAAQLRVNGSVQTATVTFRDPRDRAFRVRTQQAEYFPGTGSEPNPSRSVWTLFSKTGAVDKVTDPAAETSPGVVNWGISDHKTTYLLDVRDRVLDVKDGHDKVVSHNIWGGDDLLVESQVPDPASFAAAPPLVTSMRNIYTGRKETRKTRQLDTTTQTLVDTTTYAYGQLQGQVTSATDAGGKISTTTYYPTTQRVDTVTIGSNTPDASPTQSVWDKGLLSETKVYDPATNTPMGSTFKRFYDQAGRVERSESPGGVVSPEQTGFNAFSELSHWQQNTKNVDHTYNALGQNTQSVWSGSHVATLTRTFHPTGNLESVSDGTRKKLQQQTQWNQAPTVEQFFVTNLVTPWKTQTHTVDTSGKYVSLTDPEGKVHDWDYDASNRPHFLKYDGKNVQRLDYTIGGLLTSSTEYDATGLVEIFETNFKYDTRGRKVQACTYQSSTWIAFSDLHWDHDNLDRIVKITYNHLATEVNLEYDGRDQVKREWTNGNASGTANPNFTNIIGPVGTGNESAMSNFAQAAPGNVQTVAGRDVSYTYDQAGNRKTMVPVSGTTTTYTYNSNSQLTQEVAGNKTVAHQYDFLGNEKKRTTTVQVNPNLISIYPETYTYNYLNLLSHYQPGLMMAVIGGPPPPQGWDYAYWPTGERYSKTFAPNATSEVYIPRNGDVVTEYDQTGANPPTLKNSYVQGSGMDAKTTRIAATAGNPRTHYLGDMVGTLTTTLDDVGGSPTHSLKDVWGVQLSGSITERYGYAQREVENESGLVHMRARQYDPKTGRFTQTDPLRDNRSRDHYLYARNTPVMGKDPTGEIVIFVHGIGESQHRSKAPLMARGMMERWAQDGQAEQHVIHFLYGPSGPLDVAAISASQRNIDASKALKSLVESLQSERQKIANEDKRNGGKGELEPIFIMGYSNGTMVTKLALEAGMQVDGVVLAGSSVHNTSSWNVATSNTPFVRNYYSSEDGWAEMAVGGGRYGFWSTNPYHQANLKSGRFVNVEIDKVDHYIDDHLKTAGSADRIDGFTEWISLYMGKTHYAPILQTKVGTLSDAYNKKMGGNVFSQYESGVK